MCPPEAPLLIVVGPTGSGKSDLALFLAEQWDGEIVNCDSVQVYRGFDIGAAKTPPAARRGIPHHLLDVAAPDEPFTAGDYQQRARQALAGITARGRLPIVAGGTGFYLRALLDGLFEGPIRDESLRQRLRDRAARRPDSLHRLLRRLDPQAAGVIHPNDSQKLIRALEVCLLARRPITALHAGGAAPLRGYRILRLGLDPPRSALRERIHERTVQMYRGGLIEETRALLAAGVPRDVKPLQSVGYAQALGVLDGRLTLAEALVETQVRTRQYAKRQMTWFRRDKDITWFASFGNAVEVEKSALELARIFLEE